MAGYRQVGGDIFDNVTWSAPDGDHEPAGPDVKSTATVDIPYSFTLDQAACVPTIVGQTAGAGTGMKESNGNGRQQGFAPRLPSHTGPVAAVSTGELSTSCS
ncbi:hypothetical protein ACQPW3_26300 [Actinosynnema sp. CA-248983]